mgnify:CR=1 FL=1
MGHEGKRGVIFCNVGKGKLGLVDGHVDTAELNHIEPFEVEEISTRIHDRDHSVDFLS